MNRHQQGGTLMRLLKPLIFAGALLVSAPALAQDNAAAPGNTAATTVDANGAAAGAPAMTPVAPDNAAVAPAEPMPADNTAVPPPAPHHGFPWGVLGLIGLIGLLGVRKVKA
jgi:hypothetical protein